MILGTAGHVDHGKSALVEALTGRRMDPLAEERRRGITLDLHFAPLAFPSGRVVGIVDVPGHEDLVRTMAAGAAGIDLVLLVIAADEGIMPQTREHLAIIEALGVPWGIPVITKADLAEPEWLSLVSGEAREWLAESTVQFGEPEIVSARTGTGVDRLRERIRALDSDHRPRHGADDLARLPIDRAFSLAGPGTVVTGTTWSGTFHLGQAVRILPAGLEGRIRTLEEHGQAVEQSTPGRRLAVGLAGISRQQVGRGDVLVSADDPWLDSWALDVELHLLPELTRGLTHQARVRVLHGTREAMARVLLRGALDPGGTAPARLIFEIPVVARGGDRLVLRSYSPVRVIGGGRVLDPAPPAGRLSWPKALQSDTPVERLEALVERRPQGLEERSLPVILGLAPVALGLALDAANLRRGSGILVTRPGCDAAEREALTLVRRHHAEHAAEPGVSVESVRRALRHHGAAAGIALETALRDGRLLLDHSTLRTPDFRPVAPAGLGLLERVIEAVEAAGLAPGTVAELEQGFGPGVGDALRLATRQGRLVAVGQDRYYSPAALERFVTALRHLGGAGAITPAATREATGLSRKFLIPLLEWADRQGITRREGDARVLVRLA